MITGNSNMNSTSDVDREIKKLFDIMLRMRETTIGNGKVYFPVRADKDMSSYYEVPQHEAYVNFSCVALQDQVQLSKSFQEMWEDLNSQEFLPLANALSEIAFKL